MSAPEGRILGAYQLKGRIGRGGMGEVYRAEHLRLGREAAIKILPANLVGESDFLRRFEREAASAAALNHPNILAIYDYGEQDGTPYLVMPYIKGGTLKDRLERGDVTPAQIARYLTQIAEALDFAHGKGIIHRDVKPANVLIDEHDQAYLADFGIAKALEGTENLTRTGMGVGTPEYMAPEQARGQADPRSDLYALGIMVYQLIVGTVPYSGNSTVEVLMQHLQQPIPLEPLRNMNPGAAQVFGPILERALAKDPNHRYQTGRELMQAVNVAIAQTGFDRWASAPTVVVSTARPSRPGTPPPNYTFPPSQPGTSLSFPAGQGTPPPFSAGQGTPPPFAQGQAGVGAPPPFTPVQTATSDPATLPFGLTERNMLIIGGLIVAVAVLVCLCLAVTLSLSSRP
jgi:eukaryotic-like serine/threonine-protein kinase